MAKKRKPWIDVVIIVVAVGVGLAGSLRVWNAYGDQKSRGAVNQNDLRAIELKNEDLLRERARAESRWGREEIGRRNGFIGQGEVPIESLK